MSGVSPSGRPLGGKLLGRNNAIDQAEFKRAFGIKAAAEQGDFHDNFLPDVTR